MISCLSSEDVINILRYYIYYRYDSDKDIDIIFDIGAELLGVSEDEILNMVYNDEIYN